MNSYWIKKKIKKKMLLTWINDMLEFSIGSSILIHIDAVFF